MELSPDTRRRIAEDHVIWLTTITRHGVPAPNPVWFVADGDDLVVFSAPSSRKVANIQRAPTVTADFNCDHAGGDVVILTGPAELTHRQPPSRFPGYLAKYHDDTSGRSAPPSRRSTAPTTPRSGSAPPASGSPHRRRDARRRAIVRGGGCMTSRGSDRLLFRNTMRITPGHLDEFKAAVIAAVGFAEQHAPQLLVDVFIDADGLAATSFQLYPDSDAVLRHWELSDPTSPR